MIKVTQNKMNFKAETVAREEEVLFSIGRNKNFNSLDIFFFLKTLKEEEGLDIKDLIRVLILSTATIEGYDAFLSESLKKFKQLRENNETKVEDISDFFVHFKSIFEKKEEQDKYVDFLHANYLAFLDKEEGNPDNEFIEKTLGKLNFDEVFSKEKHSVDIPFPQKMVANKEEKNVSILADDTADKGKTKSDMSDIIARNPLLRIVMNMTPEFFEEEFSKKDDTFSKNASEDDTIIFESEDNDIKNAVEKRAKIWTENIQIPMNSYEKAQIIKIVKEGWEMEISFD